MADCDGECVSDFQAGEPRRVDCREAGAGNLGDVAVDVVAEQCRRVLGDAAEMSVRKKAGLDEGLESVADSENEATSGNEAFDCLCYILIVQYIGNELAASVRFVTGRESAAECQDVAFFNIGLHLGYGVEDVLGGEIAEHAHLHLRSGLAECLGSVVVAVCSREYREVGYRFRNLLPLVSEVNFLGLVWLHAFGALRKETLHYRLAGSGIYSLVACECTLHEVCHRDVLGIDSEAVVHAGCHEAEIFRIFEIKASFGFYHD